jgi:signal transduction histidine kinase
MKRLTYIFCLFYSLTCNAQYADDLQRSISDVRNASYIDSARLFSIGEQTIRLARDRKEYGAIADVHLYYGNHFFYTRDFEKAEMYFIKAEKEAELYNNENIRLLANVRLSFLKFERGNTVVAEDELKLLLKEAGEKKDYTNQVEILNLLGIILETKNDLKGALKLYLEGLTISEVRNLSYYPAVFRNNLGLIKLYSGQAKEALSDFEKGLAISERENNKRLSSNIQMNICMIKVADNNPEQAIRLFAKVIEYSKNNHLPTELASNYLNLSQAFYGANRTDEALSYIDSAIYILEKHNLKIELTKAYLGKTNTWIEAKNIKAAETTLKKVDSLTKITGNLEDMASSHQLRYQIRQAQKNIPGALEEYLAFSQIKDSLNNQLNSKVIQQLQHSFDVQKKEIELEREKAKSLLLEESGENERLLKWLAIGTGVVVVIFLGLILNNRYVRKLRQKQQAFSRQLIQNIEEERKRIAIDLHDDIGQSLSIIKSRIVQEQQLRTQTGDENKLENVDVALSQVIEQTREISRNLFPSNIEKIGLVRSVALMMESIQASTRLVCSFEITEAVEILSIEQKTHLFRVIQECTNNTIRHSGASGLKINISNRNNNYTLVYQDNGKGISGKTSSNGIGLRSLHERARILNGTIDISEEKNKGFKLTIEFTPYK